MLELSEIQFGMEESEITKAQLVLEQSAQIKTFHSFRQKEEYLRLKSRSLWLQAGDKKYAFFHRQCKVRISRNHISEIYTSEGEVIKGHSQIQQAAQSHFQQFLIEDGVTDNAVNAEFLSNIPS